VALGGFYAVRGHIGIRLEEGEGAVRTEGEERKNWRH